MDSVLADSACDSDYYYRGCDTIDLFTVRISLNYRRIIMDKKAVLKKLREFIITELMQNPDYDLKEGEKLFSNGVLDSFAIAQIGVFVETDFDLYIPDAELTVENMDTVGMMADSVIAGLEAQED